MEAKTNNWEKRIDDLHVEGKLKEVDKDWLEREVDKSNVTTKIFR